MQKRTPAHGPRLLLTAEMDESAKRAVRRRVASGELLELHKGVYTSHPEQDWVSLVQAERNRILAALHPGSVFAGMSAFYGGMPKDGAVHLTGTSRKDTKLPGLTVYVRAGAGPQPSDFKVSNLDLFQASEARLMLENLAVTRVGSLQRAVGIEEVEKRLLAKMRSHGLAAVLTLRDEAKDIAPALGLSKEYEKLNHLVASLNGTDKVPGFKTPQGRAFTAKPPYDLERVVLFNTLAAALLAKPLEMPAPVTHTLESTLNFAFLESYFSNFIEGTEFPFEEARDIAMAGKIVETRPKDSHDILGVYNLAKDPAWATLTLPAGDIVLDQLRQRHQVQMNARPEAGPGEFKTVANRVGVTQFVDPSMVNGTLIQGVEILQALPAGTARALFAMFLVAEVHPFNDGNGRLARLVMNAELSHAGGCRIIVPTLFRDEYVDGLRAMSAGDPEAYIRSMLRIHDWTSRFNYDNLAAVEKAMRACNAFEVSPVNFKLKFPV